MKFVAVLVKKVHIVINVSIVGVQNRGRKTEY